MAFREVSLETKATPARVWQVWSDVNSWPACLLAPVVGPMMGGMILKTFNSVLEGLKQKVESSS